MGGNLEWKHRIEATSIHRAGSGARSRIAWWLRNAADKLDRGLTIHIKQSTTPQVPATQVAECINLGLTHASRMLQTMARQEACEQYMRSHMPGLFADAERVENGGKATGTNQ